MRTATLALVLLTAETIEAQQFDPSEQIPLTGGTFVVCESQASEDDGSH